MTIVVTTTTINTETLAGVTARVLARGYESDITSPIEEIIRGVHRRVCAHRHWPWLEREASAALVAGDDSVALTALAGTGLLVQYVDAVRVTDALGIGSLMDWLPYQEFSDLAHTNLETGLPVYWTMTGTEVKIAPTLSAAYTVKVQYIVAPQAQYLNDVNDVVLVPEAFDDVIVWGTIKELAFRQRDPEGYGQANAEYTAILNQMAAEYGIRQRQQSGQVGHWHGWDTRFPANG